MFVRQTNFGGGELAPALWGRTDSPLFHIGLRTCRNFFPDQHGMLVSRPGSLFVAYGQSVSGKLIPFVVDDSTSFVLEVSANGKIGFYRSGGVLQTGGAVAVWPTANASPYTITHPYQFEAQASLNKLQWSQVGDVLTLTHPSYVPYELKRLSNSNWTLTPVTTKAVDPWFAVADSLTNFGTTLPPQVVNVPYTVTTPTGNVLVTPISGDADHPPREWIWKATSTVQRLADGLIFETLPFQVINSFDGVNATGVSTALPSNNYVSVYPGRPVLLRRGSSNTAPAAPAAAFTHKVLSVNFYRGRGTLFGFIGSTKTRDFIDNGAEPDYVIQPPQGTDPFTIPDLAAGTTRVEHPAANTFFQERRVFGGTSERGGWLFASASGNYVDFDTHIVPIPGESLVFELAARRRESILSLVGTRRLLAFTRSSVWSIGGVQGSPLDFDSIDARVEEEIGSIGLPPLVLDNSVLYARAKGVGVRSLIYDARTQTYNGEDISFGSQHLFMGQANGLPVTIGGPSVLKSVADWCYAEDPWSLVWAVRSDGQLLSLTYSDGKAGWARHDTDGYYRSICSVPEGDEDAVYALVTRAIGGSTAATAVERFTSRHRRGNSDDDAAVDCGVRYAGAPTLTIGNLAHLNGKQVYAVSVGNPPQGPYTVAGGQITLDELPAANTSASGVAPFTSLVLFVGMMFTPEMETLDLAQAEVRMRNKTLVGVGFEVDQTRGLSVGQKLTTLTKWEQRQVNSSYAAPSAATTFVRLPVLGTIDTGARAALRQTLPLPVTVLGLTREVDVGGSGSG